MLVCPVEKFDEQIIRISIYWAQIIDYMQNYLMSWLVKIISQHKIYLIISINTLQKSAHALITDKNDYFFLYYYIS